MEVRSSQNRKNRPSPRLFEFVNRCSSALESRLTLGEFIRLNLILLYVFSVSFEFTARRGSGKKSQYLESRRESGVFDGFEVDVDDERSPRP